MGKLRNSSTSGGVLSSTEQHRPSKQSKQIFVSVLMIRGKFLSRIEGGSAPGEDQQAISEAVAHLLAAPAQQPARIEAARAEGGAPQRS